MEETRRARLIQFGVFTVDLKAGELFKEGCKIKLQEKPFQILAALLEHPGEVITREELRERLWPADTFVDFDHSLKTAIGKIREALGDSAESPRFVETVARRGYRFVAPVETPGLPSLPSRRPQAGRVMLAVLPFKNLSSDAKQEYFSDGMTEEMIAQLGSLHPQEIGVIARTSAMRYKHTNKGIDQIGQELNVDHIIEGSVRRAGDRVRITAQLIQVSDQTHLWAESYEHKLRDVLTVQNQVAQAITQQIRVKLTQQEQARLTSPRPVNPEAHETYLKGRYHWNQRSEEGIKKSIHYFQQAIERDPAYGLAYAGLADSYRILAVFSLLPPSEAMPRAKAAATKALELDDTLAEAHASLAAVRFRFEWDWLNSEIEFKRAFELNPSYAEAHRAYALYLQALGRLEEAIAETKQAQELDPLSPLVRNAVGWAFYFARRYDEAIELYQKTLETDPNFLLARYNIGRAYAQKGMYRESIVELEKVVELSQREPPYLAGLGNAYAALGKRRDAESILDELKELSRRRYVCPYDMASVYAGLDNKDQALEWLQKAYEARSVRLVFVKVDPGFDFLRSDPRSEDLMRRLNFPQYAQP